MKTILISILIFISIPLFSQINVTTKRSFAKKESKTSTDKPDYMPVLINNPNLNANFQSEKGSIQEHDYYGESKFSTSKEVELPFIMAGFQDAYDGYSVPNDNTIAVSNSGYMITMRNSKISFYNDTLGLIQTQSLDSFTESLGLPHDKYDPRVIYDYDQDRFVVVMLSGFNYSTNDIIVCFSSSDNPEDEWFFYTISGNFLDDETWSDFPIIAVNSEELFITVTNFADMTSFNSWDFYGCRIIQMDKFAGYNGEENIGFAYHVVDPGFNQPLPSVIYYYNVAPVRPGKTMYGPQMYFVSTLDCPYQDIETQEWPSNDTLFLVKFSGKYDSEDFEITSKYLQTEISYGLSHETPQPSGHALKTNYNTIKDALIENDIIHFVLNSIDYNNSRAGILYGRITDPDGESTVESDMISFDTLGIAFPSIAFVGKNSVDQKIIIGFNYASEELYPGNACIVYDNGNYSDILVLKPGVGVMNMTASNTERWGDFTTIQQRYNNPEIVYFTGSYGSAGKTRTWVSQLSFGENNQGFDNNNFYSPANVYPNPVSDFIIVNFDIPTYQICTFTLYDINGKLIHEIIRDKAKPGINQFSFSIKALSQGTYILNISGDKGYKSEHKIIVQN
ncbi:MAG: T9SS type A sorting domain-containing protein [Bacteroidales bacterium]|nr:T9SS type A sorting domain-containing protein [Bacteroidales bacterium]